MVDVVYYSGLHLGSGRWASGPRHAKNRAQLAQAQWRCGERAVALGAEPSPTGLARGRRPTGAAAVYRVYNANREAALTASHSLTEDA